MQSLDLEIRERLSRYLNGDLSLSEFQEWFVPVAWEAQGSANDITGDLLNEIELDLAEFTSGHRSEEELRGRWLPFVRGYVTRVRIGGGPGAAYRTASGSAVEAPAVTLRLRAADGSLVAASS